MRRRTRLIIVGSALLAISWAASEPEVGRTMGEERASSVYGGGATVAEWRPIISCRGDGCIGTPSVVAGLGFRGAAAVRVDCTTASGANCGNVYRVIDREVHSRATRRAARGRGRI